MYRAFSDKCDFSSTQLILTLPAASASEVTTKWRYTNLYYGFPNHEVITDNNLAYVKPPVVWDQRHCVCSKNTL